MCHGCCVLTRECKVNVCWSPNVTGGLTLKLQSGSCKTETRHGANIPQDTQILYNQTKGKAREWPDLIHLVLNLHFRADWKVSMCIHSRRPMQFNSQTHPRFWPATESNVTVAQKRQRGSKFGNMRKHFLFYFPNTHTHTHEEKMVVENKVFILYVVA